MFTADHLNVDATCGAFLSYYIKIFSKSEQKNTIEIIARHIIENQTPNGIYPYTISKGNYQYILNVPCIHYQGVTIYYLLKMYDVIKKDWLKDSIINGIEWLSKQQKTNGVFDWSNSGHMFSFHLSGAYAFSFSVFIYASKWNTLYFDNARLSLKILRKQMHGLVFRWEKGSWASLPHSILITFRTASLGKFPLKYKLFRLGYGIQRQYARRRFSDSPLNDLIFYNIAKIFKIKYSTVEATKNFHDLFMTSECMDCLSQSLIWDINVENNV
jgi:hypothetical protein